MPRHAYSEINLHITWHTQDNSPLLRGDVESRLHTALAKRISRAGACVHAIGGTDDHVHIAASIPPTLLVSEWVGRLKGGAARDVNKAVRRKAVKWQSGYGVVSFGTKDLAWVVGYVRDQRRHHAGGGTAPRLECAEAPDGIGKPGEPG